MDATITESERKPKKKTTFEITEDRKLDSINEEEIAKQTCKIQLIKKNRNATLLTINLL